MAAFAELHTKLDQEYESKFRAVIEECKNKRAAISDELVRDHRALDRVWDHAVAIGLPLNSTQDTAQAQRTGQFRAIQVVGAIIEGCQNGDYIDQGTLFQRILAQEPQLSQRRPQVIKAQISRALLKFAANGALELVKKGTGNYPNTYRKLTKTNGGDARG